MIPLCYITTFFMLDLCLNFPSSLLDVRYEEHDKEREGGWGGGVTGDMPMD